MLQSDLCDYIVVEGTISVADPDTDQEISF